VDELGYPINDKGQLINANGEAINENGQRIDENGNLLSQNRVDQKTPSASESSSSLFLSNLMNAVGNTDSNASQIALGKLPKLVFGEMYLSDNKRNVIIVKGQYSFNFYLLHLSKDVFTSSDGMNFIDTNNPKMKATVINNGPPSYLGETINGRGIKIVVSNADSTTSDYYFYSSDFAPSLVQGDSFISVNLGQSNIYVNDTNSFDLLDKASKILASYTSIDGINFSISSSNNCSKDQSNEYAQFTKYNQATVMVEQDSTTANSSNINTLGQCIRLTNTTDNTSIYYYWNYNKLVSTASDNQTSSNLGKSNSNTPYFSCTDPLSVVQYTVKNNQSPDIYTKLNTCSQQQKTDAYSLYKIMYPNVETFSNRREGFEKVENASPDEANAGKVIAKVIADGSSSSSSQEPPPPTQNTGSSNYQPSYTTSFAPLFDNVNSLSSSTYTSTTSAPVSTVSDSSAAEAAPQAKSQPQEPAPSAALLGNNYTSYVSTTTSAPQAAPQTQPQEPAPAAASLGNNYTSYVSTTTTTAPQAAPQEPTPATASLGNNYTSYVSTTTTTAPQAAPQPQERVVNSQIETTTSAPQPQELVVNSQIETTTSAPQPPKVPGFAWKSFNGPYPFDYDKSIPPHLFFRSVPNFKNNNTKYHTFKNHPFFTSANTKKSTVETTVREIWYDNNIAEGNNAKLFGFTNNTSNKGGENISLIFRGYFKPNTTGVWKFMFGDIKRKINDRGNDDISVFWIDDKKNVNQTTTHWPPSDTNWNNKTLFNSNSYELITYESATLTAGIYYPIQLSWGQSGGGSFLKFSFSGPGTNWRSNGDGFFFSNKNPKYPSTAQPSNTSALILYYPFNVDVKNYASGTGVNDGQLVGSSGTTVSIDKTLYKTGSGSLKQSQANNSSYFNLPKLPANTKGYSFSFWMRFTSTTSGMIFSFTNFINPSTNHNSNRKRIYIYNTGPTGDNGMFPRNNLRFYCNGSYNNIGSLYPSINTWNHYVWTLDTNNNNRIYINNVLKDTSTTPTYASFRLDNNSILGDKGLRANGQQGNIDDFRYYDGILTPDQVSQLYSMRNP
jgi:hypothetical protein